MGVLLKINQKDLSQNTLDRIVAKARKKFDIPAAAVAVFNSENILYQTVQGVRIINTKEVVKEDDIFHVGSCSKYVLSLIAGKKVEEGLIKWNTNFFELFPELKQAALKEYYETTLENLLLCEAGIQPFTSGAEIAEISVCIFLLNFRKKTVMPPFFPGLI